jgi:hypothetical protein
MFPGQGAPWQHNSSSSSSQVTNESKDAAQGQGSSWVGQELARPWQQQQQQTSDKLSKHVGQGELKGCCWVGQERSQCPDISVSSSIGVVMQGFRVRQLTGHSTANNSITASACCERCLMFCVCGSAVYRMRYVGHLQKLLQASMLQLTCVSHASWG